MIKKNEPRFSEPHDKIESLINSIDGIVWEADPNTFQFTFVSKKAEKILGYPVKDWLKDNFWPDHMHPDDKKWAVDFCILSTNQKKGYEFEYRMIAKDGSIVWLRDIVTVISENNKPVLLLGIMVDIIERKKAEETIQLSHQRLLDAELLGKTGYWYRDVKDGKLIWSEGTYRIFGETPGNFKGDAEDFMRRINPSDKERVKKIIQEVYDTKKPASYEFWIKTPDDEDRYIGNSVEVVLDDKQNIVSLFGNTIDLTERKKADEEIKKSYAEIRRLTEYLQNIREKERSHVAREIHDELGQQLTVLKIDISWLNKRIGKEDKEVDEKLERLIQMLDEAMKTIRRISYALRPGILDDLGLIAAIEWHLGEFSKHSGIEIDFNYPSDDIKLPDTFNIGLFRIFQESLTNVALHADAKKVKVNLGFANNNLILKIADDGKGFEKESIKDKHTLGLLGMKERTFAMGGIYHIDSKPGKGTTIVVSIPEKMFPPKLIAGEKHT